MILTGLALWCGICTCTWYISKAAGLPGWVLPVVILFLQLYAIKRFLDAATGVNDED
jgi:hypothetical protein